MIDNFSGKHSYLSNFYLAPLTWRGWKFPSSEHAYQAAKCEYKENFDAVRLAPTPALAKRIANNHKVKKDFHTNKVKIMTSVVRHKFYYNPGLLKQLLNTEGDLIEGNHWGDTFWGVCEGVGENHLGKILMRIREEETF